MMNCESVPLVCTLSSPQFAQRRAEIQSFLGHAKSVIHTPDGVQLTFQNTSEIAHALTDFILFEQHCCSSLVYELRSEPPHAELILNLHAPKHQTAALQAIYLPA